MQDDDEALGDLYRSGREIFRPTAEQEQKIWAALPGAPESNRRRIIDEALWAALQYIEFAAGTAASEEKPSPQAATYRRALAAAEKALARSLKRLKDVDRIQRALDAGSLHSVHILGGPPVACEATAIEVENFVAEAEARRKRFARQKSGPPGNWPMRWLVRRLTSVWELATGAKATRYRDSGAGVLQFIESVVAVAGFVITEGQIDYFVRTELEERKGVER